jgi:glycosyltransferase involved in cell wall biosynthesis
MTNNIFGHPSVDVIIPVFNGELYLEVAIRSVLSQTYPVNKLILCDDGSEDGTALICQQFQTEHENVLYRRLPKGGVSAARNAGIAASSSDLVAFLDADDIWLSTKLEAQVQVLGNSSSNVGFVHSSYFLIDAQGNKLSSESVVPPKLSGNIFLPLVLENYTLSGSASSVLVRRDVLDEAGYFDEQLFYGEDWDLWIRLAKISEVNFTPEPVVGIRVHSESAQRRAKPDRAIQFFQQQMLVYAKWKDLVDRNKHFKKNLRQRAVEAVLPVVKHPQQAHDFYISLTKSESPVVRSVFRNSFHFWCEVSFAVLEILWRRVKRKAGLHVRKK